MACSFWVSCLLEPVAPELRGIGQPRRDWAIASPARRLRRLAEHAARATASRYCRRRRWACSGRWINEPLLARARTMKQRIQYVGVGREPGRVGRRIKVPCRADQAEISFLDQVVEGNPTLFVVADGVEHQAQIRRDQLLLGVDVTRLAALGQRSLFAGREPASSLRDLPRPAADRAIAAMPCAVKERRP